jgi:hypothetical protein
MNLNHDVAYDNPERASLGASRARVLRHSGRSENSYIIHKVEGRPALSVCACRSAVTVPSDGQILILKRWIEIGAPRN